MRFVSSTEHDISPPDSVTTARGNDASLLRERLLLGDSELELRLRCRCDLEWLLWCLPMRCVNRKVEKKKNGVEKKQALNR